MTARATHGSHVSKKHKQNQNLLFKFMRARDQLLAQYYFTFLKDRLVNIQLISLIITQAQNKH